MIVKFLTITVFKLKIFIMKRTLHFLIMISLCFGCGNTEHIDGSGDYVILLHGIGKSSSSMEEMEHYLSRKGYSVVNDDYPSTDYTIEEISNQYLHGILQKHCTDTLKRINFVTHSMGGIIVRYYMQSIGLKNIGRVVMLSPPNEGSELADIYGALWPVRWVLGPAVRQLGRGENSVPLSLGGLNFEAGIITGRSTLDPVASLLIPGEDDGRVSVENARVENMKDFLVVDSSHSFIMDSPVVLKQTAFFLKNGRFKK